MPVCNAIWKVGTSPQLLTEARLPSEKTLEDMIVSAPSPTCSGPSVRPNKAPTITEPWRPSSQLLSGRATNMAGGK